MRQERGSLRKGGGTRREGGGLGLEWPSSPGFRFAHHLIVPLWAPHPRRM
jgi:hypothetical protein